MARVMTGKTQAEYTIPESAYRSFPVPETHFQDSYASTTDSNDSFDEFVKFEDMFANEVANTAKDEAVWKQKKGKKDEEEGVKRFGLGAYHCGLGMHHLLSCSFFCTNLCRTDGHTDVG
jgi:hypothetical protein